MQVIIPMSGHGERFRRAGYDIPKPLIDVDGSKIIEHVVSMFPVDSEFIFICNNDHLHDVDLHLEEMLYGLRQNVKIVGIESHKLGPVHAVMSALDMIDLDRPVIISYCDFYSLWSWQDFMSKVADSRCFGAIPCYTGFHPHMLHNTNYAYVKSAGLVVSDIQEKMPYTSDPMSEYASAGIYYFSSARLMSAAFQYVFDNDLKVNGEYYVSLAYKHLLTRGLKTIVFELDYFMQWGTPEDLREYQYWSKCFSQLTLASSQLSLPETTLIIPMAGRGERFRKVGYTQDKLMLPVSGRPMFLQSVKSLPKCERNVFLIREDNTDIDTIRSTISLEFDNAAIIELSEITSGQATTAAMGVKSLVDDYPLVDSMLLIGCCDAAICFSQPDWFSALESGSDWDVIVFGAKNYPYGERNPESYGWVVTNDDNIITDVAVKSYPSSTGTPYIMVGIFMFRNRNVFDSLYSTLINASRTVNGEFYIDTMIGLAIETNLRAIVVPVDYYICWGTPGELLTFEYWQNCFTRWHAHAYDGRGLS